MLLTNVTHILIGAIVVIQYPLLVVVDLVKPFLVVKILPAVLIEDHFGHVVLARDDELVHLASFVTGASSSVAVGEKAGTRKDLLFIEKLHMDAVDEVVSPTITFLPRMRQCFLYN